MRIVFMGTSPFGLPALNWLSDSRHNLVGVFTQPPRPSGRGHKTNKTAIHARADALGLPVETPSSLRSQEAQRTLAAFNADLAIVAAYGLILPPAILATPRLGAVNIHASLLPRWRGAAPIQRALLAGDEKTGVSLFQMEKGLDTGPVYAEAALVIGPDMTAPQLHDRLAEMAVPLLEDLLDAFEAGNAAAKPQPETGVVYAEKITKEEGRIDFSEPARMIERRLRTLNPWPGCFCHFGQERLNLLSGEIVDVAGEPGEVIDAPLTIACGEKAISVTHIKRAGKRAMTVSEFLRGMPVPIGAKLA